MKKTESYEIKNCTFEIEGTKVPGVYVHDINDEFGNGDGVLFDYREDYFKTDEYSAQANLRRDEEMVLNKLEIALRPSYWANVSGGKDSLYMLNLILHNLDKYPLNGVVHFELEIDYPFIKEVIDYMESECKKFGIPFFRFKPRRTWEELYRVYGFPTRLARWCNNMYKLDAKKQLDEFLKSKGYYSVCYIGYCVDEEKRYSNRNLKNVERYPLVEEGIEEGTILSWAKEQPIFNNYYKINKRCGCMFCPMATMMENAYLLKYYPEKYEYMMCKAKESENVNTRKYGRPFSVWGGAKYDTDYRDNIIRTKWLPRLEALERREKEKC